MIKKVNELDEAFEIESFIYKEIKYNKVINFSTAMMFDEQEIRKEISLSDIKKTPYILDFYKKNIAKNSEYRFQKALRYSSKIKFSNRFFSKILENYPNEYLKNYKNSQILIKIKKEISNNILPLSGIETVFFLENDLPTIVINRHKENYPIQTYIGRGTFLGNPNTQLDKDLNLNRNDSIRMFEYDFYNKIKYDPKFRLEVLKLKGMPICCSCKPLPCHGDIIKNYLDNLKYNDYVELFIKTIEQLKAY